MEIINLDMTPSTVTPNAHAGQYDASRTVRFMLKNGGVPFTLAGTETITAEITRSDNTEVTVNVTNTSSNYVDVVFDDTVCTVKGLYACELRLKDSDGFDIGSKNFALLVQRDPYDGAGIHVVTVGPADICTFETTLAEPLQSVLVNVVATGGNGTPWIDSNEVNKEPYIKRAVAGTASRIGNHLYDKLVGGTVAFNQLIQNGNFINTDNWIVSATTISVSNNEALLTPTGGNAQLIQRPKKIYKNHVYMPFMQAKGSNNTLGIGFYFYPMGTIVEKKLTTSYSDVATIYKYTGDDTDFSFVIILRYYNRETYTDTYTIKNLMLIDLTAMFSGSTIADYIYSLEQVTAGSGVNFFRNLFPKDYYAYNAGELMSVKATAHVMKNASNTVIGNYALDSNLELRGIPKLVNNKLEYDGDTYESNGDVTRRYGIVDLGSLEWVRNTQGFFNASLAGLKFITDTGKLPNLISLPYITDTPANVFGGTTDKTISTATGGSNIWIRDAAYSDPAAFKAAMSGVLLVYELATPATETADPFTNPQVCDENGTEEYTDSRAVAIPVGHETYQANICPITGYSSANITRCGVNLLNPDTLEKRIVTSTNNMRLSYAPMWLGGGSYTLSFSGSQSIYLCDINNNYATTEIAPNMSPYTFTLAERKLIMFRFSIDTVGELADTNIQLEVGNTATDYTPYTGNTYTTAFGQTVYGGVLDVTRGKLHVTQGVYTFTGNESITPITNERFRITISDYASDISRSITATDLPDSKMEVLRLIVKNQVISNENVYGLSNEGQDSMYLFIRIGATTTTEEVVTAITGKKMTYPLATPFDIDLTPEVISAVVGTNNVFADCGETTVKYLKAGG